MMNRIVAYNNLIAEACTNYCKEFKYGFYADDTTCTLTIMLSNSKLEVVTRLDGRYFFEGSVYETAEKALKAVEDSFMSMEYAFYPEFTMDDLIEYIDTHEDEFDEDGCPVEKEHRFIIRTKNYPVIEEEDPDLI